jgi:hypothetical protein
MLWPEATAFIGLIKSISVSKNKTPDKITGKKTNNRGKP